MDIVKPIKEIFKAYDIRGKFPDEINRDVAYTIGKAYGTKLLSIGKNKCIVGYDNRESSIELSLSLSLGILSTGVDVINLGLVTTPMAIYSKEVLKIPSYVMVTASHNPKDDNGFKFSFDESGNVKGDDIDKFYNLVISGNFKEGMGKFSRYNVEKDYLELFRRGINLGDKKLKVVIDLANGTTSCIARELFEQFDIDLTIINEESDSSFPNHHPDPCVAANQKQLQDKVLELHADLGIGFDGDGDRCGIVDNLGHIIPTDIYMAIMCKDIILNNEDKRILYDVKCSNALKDEIVKWGGVPICYRTGASYTMAKVIDDNILFGGEYSGHVFFNDRIPVIGSGIYAGLRMVEVLSKTDKKLSDLVDSISKYYSTEEIKIHSPNDIKDRVIEDIKKYCINMRFNIDLTDGVKIIRPDSWALIRVSNTGPNITVRFEADTEDKLFLIKREFTNLVKYFNK
ncbi:MAG: phosphomannomutase/phosphoglucomutase [Bacilli bacterium]|nr:phosphomannomutase/phosphoglucomutase [Bacilli bacterium]